MRISEIFRLVWLNLSQNKFKVILTSIGIVVGSATIMLVIAIGTGGKEEVAEQFKNLNAGAVDISYEGGNSGFGFSMGRSSFGGGRDFFAEITAANEEVVLSYEDAENLMTFVTGISDVTISYSTTVSVEGGDLDAASYYTVAGVLDNYAAISNL